MDYSSKLARIAAALEELVELKLAELSFSTQPPVVKGFGPLTNDIPPFQVHTRPPNPYSVTI